MKSATPENLMPDFKKTGIFPLNRSIIDSNMVAPAEVFHNENINVTMNDAVVDETQSVVVVVKEKVLVTEEKEGGMDDSKREYWCSLFGSRFENVKKVKSEKVVKPRNTLSKVVSGRCITESDVAEQVRVHVSQDSKNKPVEYTDSIRKKSSEKEMGSAKKNCKLKGKGKIKIVNYSSKKNVASPKPGPSHMYMYVDELDMDVDSDECVQIEEKDNCCVCGRFQPYAVRNSVSLIIVKWVQCGQV
jgi:hypothetical protein